MVTEEELQEIEGMLKGDALFSDEELLDWLKKDVPMIIGDIRRARTALELIASYGKDGVCPYGCDTPTIAAEVIN